MYPRRVIGYAHFLLKYNPYTQLHVPAREEVIFGDIGTGELIYRSLVSIAVIRERDDAHGLQACILDRVVSSPITTEQIAEVNHVER